ncbi:hypothetical protein SADUNF_Sadunf01G0132800 [Salix dunnii]|uniref:RRM domain-containing protein n=1 Tax=Salix dunnii TaxID=1413687 RepID=A0A835NBN7_9ROSI|nr:hypothetical protein SADUNF_Sadunf01G0132800 [Salix dunnii]
MKFNNIYVKNSAESATDEGLKDVFTEHGAKSKCFEFVNFEKAEDADKAIKTLDGKEIEGKECYVGKCYMKTGGATFEGNPDGRLATRGTLSKVSLGGIELSGIVQTILPLSSYNVSDMKSYQQVADSQNEDKFNAYNVEHVRNVCMELR